MYKDHFLKRHLGSTQPEEKSLLKTVGVPSIENLIEKVIPSSIRISEPLKIPEEHSEYDFLQKIKQIGAKNKLYKNYIGLGYYDCITPPVIQRNIFENPGWYTQYTPYQSEISQGRLEALYHFQTMIVELTGMEIANASLLDEATAAAESMTMLQRQHQSIRGHATPTHKANVFFVSRECFPQTISVLHTRAEPLGIEIEIGEEPEWEKENHYYGMLLQYPTTTGAVFDYRKTIQKAQEKSIAVAMLADLLSLTLLEPPGSFGVDVVVGSTQRFGIPLGYGGPHAAYMATLNIHKRAMPGRLIGLSIDRLGQASYRLALQTREQHIRKEKATSNICTAQALLGIMAAMYVIYHGPEGLRSMALEIHMLACDLEKGLKDLGYKQKNFFYFDTLCVDLGDISQEACRQIALEEERSNLCYLHQGCVGISLDETKTEEDVVSLLSIFAKLKGKKFDGQAFLAQRKLERKAIQLRDGQSDHHCISVPSLSSLEPFIPFIKLPEASLRKTNYLSQKVFHEYRSETAMMRYIRRLEGMDLALNQAMIPLGSCTMKLNPAVSLMPVSLVEFSSLHPFVPEDQGEGYRQIFSELETFLSEITGMSSTSLQPNSGAQGELTGLLVIRAYHKAHNQKGRNIALIPTSAHGTNPSSASMAGMSVVPVRCDQDGNIDIVDLKQKAEKYRDLLSCVMITYPSTHGVFEENIQEICQIIHNHGGLVYLDGANMNAQVGLCNPRNVGADVCHLNLHKTFSIPHGGGGPGMGPICVTKELAPYLPGHKIVSGVGGSEGISSVAATPWGSASILLISYAYIQLLGAKGMQRATEYAILNANYIKKRLEAAYKILYTDKNGFVAHEMILDIRPFRQYGIEVEDIAKRLIDYGFHAPTMSWPVPGSLMIEPTESEPKRELDRFCDAMLTIREEIEEIIQAKAEPKDNVLKNAPHPAHEVVHSEWKHSYTREKAAYPLQKGEGKNREDDFKFWPPRARVDNAYGDRNLVCSCPPMDSYEENIIENASYKTNVKGNEI